MLVLSAVLWGRGVAAYPLGTAPERTPGLITTLLAVLRTYPVVIVLIVVRSGSSSAGWGEGVVWLAGVVPCNSVTIPSALVPAMYLVPSSHSSTEYTEG